MDLLSHLAAIIASSDDAIVSKTLDGTITSWNPSAERMFGYTAEEMIGQPIIRLIPPERQAEETEILRQLRAGQRIQHYETVRATKDGRRLDVSLTISPMKDHAGHIIGASKIIRDITERKRTESLILQAQERLQMALKAGNAGLWTWNLKTNEVEFSLSWKVQLGYAGEELPNRFEEFETRLHPDDHDRVLQGVRAFIENPAQDYEDEFRLRHKDGSYRWFSTRADVKTDQGGRPEWMMGCNIDITERKKLSDALQTNDERLRLIARSAKDLLWDWDLVANVLWWNESLQTALGYRSEEMEPGIESWQNRIHPEDREKVLSHVHTVIDSGQDDWSGEYRFRHADGSYSYYLDRGYVLHRDREGHPLRMLGSMVDITARKTAEEELNEAKVAAESANRAKSAFLASMSHEIRTPMNGIIGMTGLLLDTEMTAEQREYAGIVRRSGDVLLNIIDDILDFSELEAGVLTLETIDFDLRTMVEETLDLFAEPAQRKGIELGYLLHAEVPTALRGDPGRVRQILVNVTGNALKFSQQGEVTIHVSRAKETADRTLIEFAVTDTGIGIAQEAQQKLFMPFSQANLSTTRKVGGTGLGLAICKQLVEQMGGQIGVESVSGQGSTFRFTVWLSKQAAEAQETVLSPTGHLPGRRVCIVDDNATSRRILEQYVSQWGLHSASASDGHHALALMRDAATRGEPFDLAILDLQMPHMDGFELGYIITTDPLLSATRLVLLTSIGLRGQAEKAKLAGIAAYLTKPVHRAQLYECLALILNRQSKSAADATGQGRDALVTRHSLREAITASRTRILVAEDNIVNQKVAVGQLEKLGYRADIVANGLEAVEAVSRVRYALVLMDWRMPELDGLGATALIRKGERDQKRPRLPIIAMTANAMKGDREQCLLAGMDDYLPKPVRQGELGTMLARWIPVQSTENESKADVYSLERERVLECVDAVALDDLRQLDEVGNVLSTLITDFLADVPVRLSALQDALHRGDVKAVAREAHTLNGSSGNLGARRMRRLCGELQALGKAKDLTNAADLMTHLVCEFALVRQRLMAEQATIVHSEGAPA